MKKQHINYCFSVVGGGGGVALRIVIDVMAITWVPLYQFRMDHTRVKGHTQLHSSNASDVGNTQYLVELSTPCRLWIPRLLSHTSQFHCFASWFWSAVLNGTVVCTIWGENIKCSISTIYILPWRCTWPCQLHSNCEYCADEALLVQSIQCPPLPLV